MQHLAIDLGGRKSRVCIRGADGAILAEKDHPTADLGMLLAQQPKSRVIVEASAEAFRVADDARRIGHEVRVVSPHLARQLGIGERRVKTDRRDGRKLSEVSTRIDLPSIHVPSERSRELKSKCGMRDSLVESRTLLINTVRGYLRTQIVHIPTGMAYTFALRVRRKLKESGETPVHVERLLVTIEALSAQIKAASKELDEIAHKNPVCQRLMTVPGVGTITAVRFVATLDTPSRFSSAAEVRSYLGLTPGEDSSSTRVRRTGITKAGSTATRRVLIQAAWVALRYRPDDPMVRWTRSIAERKHKCIAIVALARKMAGILFAIWRDQSSYDPTQGASM